MCSKIPYETKQDAISHGNFITKAYRGRGGRTHKKNGKRMRPYKCPYCNKWHLTTMKKRKY